MSELRERYHRHCIWMYASSVLVILSTCDDRGTFSRNVGDFSLQICQRAAVDTVDLFTVRV
jgi:hypothetical protein